MGKNNNLRRGFKAAAERMSTNFRTKLGVDSNAHLCAFNLAEFLNVKIISPTELNLDNNQLDTLMGDSSKKARWSAFTLNNKNNKKVIVHNTRMSYARQQSNIMHELAHIICEHKVKVIEGHILPTCLRYYDKFQEAEAEYLGSCLQLPRNLLVWALTKENMSKEEISKNFNASMQMVNFRINSTGIMRQISAYKKY